MVTSKKKEEEGNAKKVKGSAATDRLQVEKKGNFKGDMVTRKERKFDELGIQAMTATRDGWQTSDNGSKPLDEAGLSI